MTSGTLSSPSAERNRAPILEVLRRVLPGEGLVLEIASGTGQHVAFFAHAIGSLTWQPSDPDPQCRHSIDAWVAASALPNVRRPLDLDVHRRPWPLAEPVDAIVCINMIHIAPWSATLELFAGANASLGGAGVLYLYGPYRMHGAHTAPSNEAFDRSLRERDPRWGVRDLDDVVQVAGSEGFELAETIAMPANNLSLVFRRANAGE